MQVKEGVARRILRGAWLPRPLATAAAIGYVCGLISGVFYGAWSVVAKHAVSGFSIPPLVFATLAFLFGTIMFLPWWTDAPQNGHERTAQRLLLRSVGLGIRQRHHPSGLRLGTGEVVVVSPTVAVSPLITLVLAWVLLRQLERITLTLVIAAVLVVGGRSVGGHRRHPLNMQFIKN